MASFPEESTLSKELAFAWCNAAKNNSNRRLPDIRGFARYLVSIGETAYVMPTSFFHIPKAEHPYIFTKHELEHFFEATDRQPKSRNSPILEYSIPVVFRLQYACGLRPQEVRTIRRNDFNWKDGTIYVVGSKNHKDRILPISGEMAELCRKFDLIADAVYPDRIHFFQHPSGTAYTKQWLTKWFHRCWERSGNGSERGSSTPYDLRHNFATQTLMRWVEEGKDIDACIPYLSAFMGHACFKSTYYYIHLLPERLSKMDFTSTAGIIPEVDYEEA
jgi:integrase